MLARSPKVAYAPVERPRAAEPAPEPAEPWQLRALVALQGVSLLFPWNAVCTGVDFFIREFPDESVAAHFALAYNAPNFVMFLLQLRWLRLRLRATTRVWLAYALYLPVLFALPHLRGSYGATLAAVSVLGCAGSLLQGTLFGIMARFRSAACTQTLMAGNGVSGIAVSLLRVALRDAGAATFFNLAGALVAACLLGFRAFLRREETVRAFRESPDHTAPDGAVAPTARRVGAWMACVFLVFTCTLSEFPGMVARIGARHDCIVPLVATFLWCDFAGRAAAGALVGGRRRDAATVGAAVLVRGCVQWALFPMFVDGQIGGAGPAYVLVAWHGLSNGLLASLAMMHAPQAIGSGDKELAGILMTGALTAGLVAGSLMGNALGWYFGSVGGAGT